MVTLESLCPNCMTSVKEQESCNTCGDQSYPQYTAIALPAKTLLNDRFWIGRVLGRPGGFGMTYLAWDTLLETPTAIKEYLPLQSAGRTSGDVPVMPNSEHDRELFEEGLRIFLQEAKTLARFSHPNIVRIRDYFTANNTAYLVMDYHKGIPFDQYVAKQGGRLSQESATELMLPILNGLEYVHSKNFLHRDIKPQNIFLTDDGAPILLDFGAARYALLEKSQTLTVMLTGGFAPFEQYHRKGNQGPWSDIYACGATLYYLVTGKIPADALERQSGGELIPPIKLNSAISESFNMAILKAMAIDTKSRPQNITGFKRLLFDHSIYSFKETQIIESSPIAETGKLTHASTGGREVRSPERVKPSVIIRYQNENKGGSLKRYLLIILLAVVGWFFWNGRYLPEPDGGAMIMVTNDPFGLAAEGDMIVLMEDLPDEPESIVDLEQASAGPWFKSDPPDEILRHTPRPTGDNAVKAPEKRTALPRPPAQSFEACRHKPQGVSCRFKTSFGLETGTCMPTEGRLLVCIPRGMPPPPKSGVRPAYRGEPMKPVDRKFR